MEEFENLIRNGNLGNFEKKKLSTYSVVLNYKKVMFYA